MTRQWVMSTPSRNLVRLAKRRAKKAGLEFSLTHTEIAIPQICPVLGVPIVYKGEDRDAWPSLDRVDPARGYTKNNVRVISYRANRIKNDASAHELELVLKYVLTAGGEGENPNG